MNTALFDAELLRRYDRPGPRYTSYPTAPQFGADFDETALRDCIRHSNAASDARRLSLYLHVPYCFSPCFYCGCNRIISRDQMKGRGYVARLVREIEQLGALFEREREVIQLHLGGGTPNFLRPAQLAEVVASLGSHFQLSTSAERDFSLELDPRFIEPGDVAQYARLGFNRASLGVQDFDPDVQRAVNRLQSIEQTLRVIEACRSAQFRSINVDLIYGLPKQSVAGFERTLDTVLAARPDRLAVYGYAHLPELFKAQTQIEATDLPSPEAKLALLRLAIEKLSAAGYAYIGMDHFALPEDDLARAQAAGTLQRNFMGYTTHAQCDLVGIGMSAISHIGDSFSQNPRDLAGWERALDQGRLPVWRGRRLDRDDVLRADVIQQLMCQGYIDTAALEQRHHIDFQHYFSDALQKLEPLIADGLATRDGHRISATSAGRLLMRMIAMCFDRYLNQSTASAPPRYSRVI
ncbi:MAG: oxygen-independent coproporphyrinogen III oxidase [Pseudomonadota bacterium]|nr:oxygen-independent coproporphyrinogen III oxidase [Pseudomonadota bacterium]